MKAGKISRYPPEISIICVFIYFTYGKEMFACVLHNIYMYIEGNIPV